MSLSACYKRAKQYPTETDYLYIRGEYTSFGCIRQLHHIITTFLPLSVHVALTNSFVFFFVEFFYQRTPDL